MGLGISAELSPWGPWWLSALVLKGLPPGYISYDSSNGHSSTDRQTQQLTENKGLPVTPGSQTQR